MKLKILNIIFLFSLFLLAFCWFYAEQKPEKYRILKIIQANEFYIDINSNNIAEENEHVKLKGIETFAPILNTHTQKIAQQLGIKEIDFLRNGYLAQKWAYDNLYKKEVLVKGIKNCGDSSPCLIDVYFENKDLSQKLLENGLAYIPSELGSKKYYKYFNLKQIMANSIELSKLEFVLVELKNKIAHELNCKHVKNIPSELVLKNEAKYSKLEFCKKCLDFSVDYEIPQGNSTTSLTYKSFNDFDLYLINPYRYSKPNPKCTSDFCKRLLFEINNSKKSIDLALYGFGNQLEIFDALKNAQKRGVKIRVVSDKSKGGDETFSYTSKLMNSFPSRNDSLSSLMHNKFIIFDNRVVFSGSVNISSSGSGGYNANNAVFIKNKNVIEAYKKEFEQLFSSKFSTRKIKNDTSFDNSIKAYFSPQDDIYNRVLASLIKNAKKNIYVSIFYLTDKNLINDLIEAHKRGVKVLVMIDSLGASSFRQRISDLRNIGIPIIVENWGGKNHEKTIVIDDEYLLLGSCNFSKSGFYKNDENVILFKNSDAAKFYSEYFLYLFNSIDKKYLHSIPRAEGLESVNSCYDGLDNDYDGKIDLDDEACKINH